MRNFSSYFYWAFLCLVLNILFSPLTYAEEENNHLFRHPIIYKNEPIWFIAGHHNALVKKRAQIASQQFQKIIDRAIHEDRWQKPYVTATREGTILSVTIFGQPFIKFFERDAHLLGYSDLEDLALFIKTHLDTLIESISSLARLRKNLTATVFSLLVGTLAYFFSKRMSCFFRKIRLALGHKKIVFKRKPWFGISFIDSDSQNLKTLRLLSCAHLLSKSLVILSAAVFITGQFVGMSNMAHIFFDSLSKSLGIFEYVAALFLVAIIFAFIPLLSVWCFQSFIMWHGVLKCGDRIRIGRCEGEIAAITLQYIHLMGESGQSYLIPAFYLAFKPILKFNNVDKA